MGEICSIVPKKWNKQNRGDYSVILTLCYQSLKEGKGLLELVCSFRRERIITQALLGLCIFTRDGKTLLVILKNSESAMTAKIDISHQIRTINQALPVFRCFSL